jgi:hypothetical protein
MVMIIISMVIIIIIMLIIIIIILEIARDAKPNCRAIPNSISVSLATLREKGNVIAVEMLVTE